MSDHLKPTLLIDGRMVDASGIGVYIQELALRLGRWFKVTLLGDIKSPSFSRLSQSIDFIDIGGHFYNPFHSEVLGRRARGYDVYWVPHFNVPFLRPRSRVLVVTIHDVYHLVHDKDYNYLERLFLRLLYRNAVRRADLLIGVSNFTRAEALRFLGPQAEKMQVVPNGVRSLPFGGLDKRWRGVGENPYLVLVGNLKPHKNVPFAIRSFLRSRYAQSHRLVVVGKTEGFYRTESGIGPLVSTAGDSVVLTGHVSVEELVSIYRGADFLIFPSLYEGFGLPVLEAQSVGCPVLASRIPPLLEVLGDSALYFDPRSEASLVSLLDNVYRDLEMAASLVKRGMENFRRFDFDQAAESIATKIMHAMLSPSVKSVSQNPKS